MKFIKFIIILSAISIYSNCVAFSSPDLYVAPADITFSNTFPESNEVIYITSTIHNIGDSYSEPIIEYTGPVITYNLIHNGLWYAQSFTPDSDIKISFVSLMLTDRETDDSLTVNIQTSTVSNTPSGVCLSTQTINLEGEGAQGLVWTDIVFPEVVSLAANTTYWIVAKNYNVDFSSHGYGWTSDDNQANADFSIGTYSNDQGASWAASSSDRYFKVNLSSNIAVSFYNGDPDSGGTLLGTDTIVPVTSAGNQTAAISTTTPASGGILDLYVKADPDNLLVENSDSNNKNSKAMYVDFPYITAAQTLDNDNNGLLDGYLLTFNENMDFTTLAQSSTAGFTVDGYTGLHISTSSLPGTKMYLFFNEKNRSDSGQTPDILYSSTTGQFTDLDDSNLLLNIASDDIIETDGASPKLNAELHEPANGAKGIAIDTTININFAEQMHASATGSALELRAIKNNLGTTISEFINTSYSESYSSSTFTHSFIFRPATLLKNNYTYQVCISTAAKDLATSNSLYFSSFTFSTIFSNEDSNILKSPDGNCELTLPPGSIGTDFYIELQTYPLNNSASASSIETANNKLYSDSDPFTFPLTETIIEIKAYDKNNDLMTGQLLTPAELSITYSDSNSDSLVDNTSPELPEKSLQAYWLDESNDLWVKLSNFNVDTELNKVNFTSSHFSVFALRGSGYTSLAEAYAFPVPYRSDRDNKITFTNLSSVCTIKIYTLNGELVKKIRHNGSEQAIWENIEVGSGVYLYRIENELYDKKGKLVIIR